MVSSSAASWSRTGSRAALAVSLPLLAVLLAGPGLAGNLDGETVPAVARVATLGCLGSFTGPALIGALAGALDLTVALGVPALLLAATAAYARAVQPAGDPGRPSGVVGSVHGL